MGGSAAEIPAAPDGHQAQGLRASDADRDRVVAHLRDEFVAGRLSHDTFLHRVDAVLEARRQEDLPAVVADLPARRPARSLSGWLRGTWNRVTGLPGAAAAADAVSTGPRPPVPSSAAPSSAVPARPRRAVTTSMSASPDRAAPFLLQFPRGSAIQFSIGRDASCDLAIADMTVSRRHAQLERTADGWLLCDLESTNGTRVNGWRVRGKVPVRPGDLVSFGDLEVRLLRGEEPQPLP
ncbi:MAG TPA: DUF1707 and FHA domain-containing protein [Trebonia sp.]